MNSTTRLKFTQIIAVLCGIAAALHMQSRARTALTTCAKPWVFFDLGNTLVDSDPGKEMRYLSGAREYVKQLKLRGYRIGMITNVPEKWGPSSKEKVRVLKKTVKESWSHDPQVDMMDWSDFSDALILTPPRDLFRKPAPYLFKAAIAKVLLEEGETNCKVIFQGEDPKEVAAATQAGMRGHLIRQNDADSFLPISTLEAMQ